MSIKLYKPGLELSNQLLNYLRAMTGSWIRKKLNIIISKNNMAYWDGQIIYIPDIRLSDNFKFLTSYSLDYQFSFYSALTFHEALHSYCNSHIADTNALYSNKDDIPEIYHPLISFIYNLLEDGRIERIGLYKRSGTLIFKQLFLLNSIVNGHNWKIYFQGTENSSLDNEFIGHFLNQLFILNKLGLDYLEDFYDDNEEILVKKVQKILPDVFKSLNPNSSVIGAKKIFILLKPYILENEKNLNESYLNKIANHSTCKSNINSKEEIDSEYPNINFNDDLFENTLLNPFTYNKSNKDSSKNNNGNRFDNNNQDNRFEKTDEKNFKDSKVKLKNNYSKSKKIITHKYRFEEISSNLINNVENTEFLKFLRNNPKNEINSSKNLLLDDYEHFSDIFDNDSIIEIEKTHWINLSENLDNYIENIDIFNELYEKLLLIAQATANTLLKLSGIDIKKRMSAESKNQKISLKAQKTGKLELTGNNLSQLIAGNQYIKTKEIPAKLKVDIDLIILVDLTGSMGFETLCDGRIGERMEFVNEATIILATYLDILASKYKLPINFSIIGYSTNENEEPTLQLMKSFDEPYQEKKHAQAIYSWFPDGENCDARAIYEAVNLFDTLKSKSRNKTIFFLSDGGGEERDFFVMKNILTEFPKFNQLGPKDFTDAIKYGILKKVTTFVFMMETINDADLNRETLFEFKKYYGEKVNIIGHLSDLIDSLSSNLYNIFKMRR